MKYLILIGDGMSDLPLNELDGKTPLEVCNKPNIDKLTKNGRSGLIQNVPEGYTPGSDVANMSIFGYDPSKYYTGRGPLEAGSMGIETNDNQVIFRCNLIYEKDGKIEDFTAGHISSSEASTLMEDLNKHFNKNKFYPGVSYRHIMVYNSNNPSETSAFKTMPPHDIIGENINEHMEWSSEEGKDIKNIILESKKVLENHPVNLKRIEQGKKPANMIWLWGQGLKPSMDNFEKIYSKKAGIITGVDLLKGIGVYSGIKVINVPGATGYFDTDYKAKGKYTLDNFKDLDIIIVHVEAPDEAGHEGNIEEKIKAIENIDKYVLGTILDKIGEYGDYKIAILPDHPTPIDLRTHTNDEVPIAIYSSLEDNIDNVEKYDEENVKNGSLGHMIGHNLINFLINDK
ncbi:cofactor-independent phosphoglycerate mutase [Methanobrevibacter sp. DSM 116169]|uniref:cofactor-independent phosphoglycerate mutase n=1 Tax=Methanobrevibacter sp. DSM 116169 TaxID=3242727 RepID=UPI0038FCB7A6